MKLTLALLAIITTLGFGACSTVTTTPKVVSFTPCCATGSPAKDVTLIGSFDSGGTVVRLTNP